MTVDEMLALARDVVESNEKWPDDDSTEILELARAVIELLSAPELNDHPLEPGSCPTGPLIVVFEQIRTPPQARALAVALLRAADEAERSEP